jgi:hypothetical protein
LRQERPVNTGNRVRELKTLEKAQAEEPEEEGGRNFKPLIYAGCGCLLALVCLIARAVAFDWLDLYCTGPFSALQPLYSLWGGTCL